MPKKRPAITVTPVMRELSDDDLDVIVQAAHRRAALMGELKAALLAHDDRRSLELARRACGIQEAA
jgi:hypothetical protein